MNKEAVVFHIPHSSMVIPDEFLSGVVLSEKELRQELIRSTDMYCDELFDLGFGLSVVAQYSRFSCDVERFRNDRQEPNAEIGRGVFYTHTETGKLFRQPNVALKERALTEIYDKHHDLLEKTVESVLMKNESCLIIDGHSFCDDAFGSSGLPDFCIGADSFHTSNRIVKAAVGFLVDFDYTVAINYPYSGTLVPQKWYRDDSRVQSVMIEINKRLYLEDDLFLKNGQFSQIKSLCIGLIDTILRSL